MLGDHNMKRYCYKNVGKHLTSTVILFTKGFTTAKQTTQGN